MTRAVFHEDSYRTELRSVVKAVGDDWVELDQTIFYPEGGGQPGDHVLDKEDLTLRMNTLVAESHELHTGSITEAELDENPGLVRTMSVQPPRGVGDIRMIRVQDVDYQPCGGTHVRNTREVGKVLIRKIENKGKQNRRVHIVLED
jgi:misacylated tRNA(Ala) deacylase